MANLRLPLTDRICARAKPEAREYALRDTRQPGLTLRVQSCGARSWTFCARKKNKSVRHHLGSFPDTSVKEARQIASALLADGTEAPKAPSTAPFFEAFQAEHEGRCGAFPDTSVKEARQIASALLADGTEAPKAPSTAPFFEAFQAEHEGRCGAFYKPQGLDTYRSYVRRELIPAFSGKRIDTITRQDVVRWFERYSASAPGGANRALGILGQMLGRAKSWGYMPEDWRNPVAGIKANRRRVVGAFLSEAQMARFGTVLDARIAGGCTASALLRFLTMTGCRVGEAIDLEWRDVLPDRLRLRDSKTGARDVALGIATRRFFKEHRAALDRRARGARSPVFPLIGGQRYGAVRSIWLVVRREAELPDTLRIHDLRHSFASHAIMSGETLFCTSRLLGHSRIQMTARYAHLADTALLAAAERIGTILMKGQRA